MFRQEFHRGLEAIDIQAQSSIEFRQLPIGVFSDEAIITHHLTDNRSILLFDKTLIVF
jgi:hypothetical protein